MFGGDLIYDGYVVAKFSPWLQAPGPTWVHPAFDLEAGEWREGQAPTTPRFKWAVIDESPRVERRAT